MKKRPKFISIGIISKPHGVKGSIIVIPMTDELEQFKALTTISIKDQKGERQAFTIEKVNIFSNNIILKLEGINDREQAFALKGLYVDKYFDKSEKLPADEYYIFDLIGLKVITGNNTYIGEVTDVLILPANDVYIVHDDTKEYFIPAIKEVIKKIDLEEEYILIEPINGLL